LGWSWIESNFITPCKVGQFLGLLRQRHDYIVARQYELASI